MVKDLLNLKGFIQEKLPNCKITLSCPILHIDLDNYSEIIEEVNKQLDEISMKIIRNDNIKREYLT